MKTKKILLILALLCAMVQGAWADVTTVIDDGVFIGFTATSGSNTGDGGYDKLVDGNTNNKWCTNTTPFYVEFHSSGLIVPTGYIMTTGGDTQSYSGRNPKSWTIKAKAYAEDDWTTLVTVENDATMPASNYTPVEFAISGNTTAYRYFRLDVSATRGDGYLQLSEFQFMGTTTDTGNFTVNPSLNGFGTSESPYIISSTDDWNIFADKVNSGSKNYSGKYVRLDANISVTTKVGTVSGSTQQNAFCGTFLGGGNTINANIEDNSNSGTALFCYINGATIKDLTVAGTVTGAQHAAALVGFSNGTCSIENCTVSATVSGGTHIGGILGHALNSSISMSGCAFSGLMTGGGTAKGALIGWGNSGTRTVTNCLYVMADGQNTDGLDLVKGNGTVNVSNCYKTTSAGSYGTQPPYTSVPDNEICKQITVNTTPYYIPCSVSGVNNQYFYTGSAINVTPNVTYGSTVLNKGTDYIVSISPATVQEKDNYTLTITATGNYSGTKTIQFTVTDGTPVTSETTTMTAGVYAVNEDVTFTSRITISGDVTLALGEGKTLTATKGIELSQGNILTIEGPGALTISGCDDYKSGIGAAQVGTLVINGGTINATGGYGAAGIGGDRNNTDGGTITINGGIVNAKGGDYGAGIGGGYNYWESGVCGVCGDVVINGGQVTAMAGKNAQGIGLGQVYGSMQSTYYRGTLTLNWTSPNDFVYSSNFNKVKKDCTLESITIADGKQFIIAGTETTVDNTTADLASVLSGKTIWGYNYNGSIALADNDTYIRGGDLPVTSATYTKTTDRVDQYHSWLVPFDHTITADDLEKFSFYKINMIANAPNPQTNATDQIWVFLKQIGENDVLHASMPYVYKPKVAVTDYVFTADNNLLKPMKTGVIAKTETMEDIYNFYATYAPTTATAQDPFYYVNIDGGISLGNDGTVSVGAFRWIIRVESKFGSTPAYARKMTFFDGEETTSLSEELRVKSEEFATAAGWYDLQGRKLDGKPTAKGIYVNNGRKVVIK